ncbi:uncharacterized protein B0I36DRAFT_127628 [Microdochium trichocladiopsis]|uniref:Uncharacterized protein n=1 Tax=Microdochium trichocladiopsis TaxID=1682393 RepID=A0A9P8Y438_9PEZI|nr:uncharacterized protein B0I36DRAFT_127628 [Microdochium trichocladiopsis]KAH7029029.1 hypothetical protein B0I36DRAFT_127628 [Microdochium trichocladiopsis]
MQGVHASLTGQMPDKPGRIPTLVPTVFALHETTDLDQDLAPAVVLQSRAPVTRQVIHFTKEGGCIRIKLGSARTLHYTQSLVSPQPPAIEPIPRSSNKRPRLQRVTLSNYGQRRLKAVRLARKVAANDNARQASPSLQPSTDEETLYTHESTATDFGVAKHSCSLQDNKPFFCWARLMFETGLQPCPGSAPSRSQRSTPVRSDRSPATSNLVATSTSECRSDEKLNDL